MIANAVPEVRYTRVPEDLLIALMDIRSAADYLGCTETELRQWQRKGVISFFRIPGVKRVWLKIGTVLFIRNRIDDFKVGKFDGSPKPLLFRQLAPITEIEDEDTEDEDTEDNETEPIFLSTLERRITNIEHAITELTDFVTQTREKV